MLSQFERSRSASPALEDLPKKKKKKSSKTKPKVHHGRKSTNPPHEHYTKKKLKGFNPGSLKRG